MKVTDADIREIYGHNGHECHVQIRKNGEVVRYGSPDPTDRSMDFWAQIGWREDIAEQIVIDRGDYEDDIIVARI